MTRTTLPTTRTATLAALTLAALALAAAQPAAAQITALTPVNTGTNFLAAGYGQDGYVIYDSTTSPNGSNSGNALANGNTIIVKPGYVSLDNAQAIYFFGGQGYSDALPGHQAGLAGTGRGGGNVISFTTAAGAPAEIIFGVLANYTNKSPDNPPTITVTGPIGAAAVATPNGGTQNGYDYLFDIKGVSPGQTYTVSLPAYPVSNGPFISGVTFGGAPEPSQFAALGLGVLGLAGLAFKARKRKSVA